MLEKPALVIATSGLAREVVKAEIRKPLGLLGIVVYCLKKTDKKPLKDSSPSIKLISNNIHEVVFKCD